MQAWGAQREVEKPKPSTARRLTVENSTSRLTIRALEDGDGVNIWLGLDHDSLPEFIIGQGTTPKDALADCVAMLEQLVSEIQEHRHPDDWQFDDGVTTTS